MNEKNVQVIVARYMVDFLGEIGYERPEEVTGKEFLSAMESMLHGIVSCMVHEGKGEAATVALRAVSKAIGVYNSNESIAAQEKH